MPKSAIHPANTKWFLLSLFAIALDQWSKWFVTQHMQLGQSIKVLTVFNWTLLHNEGAAFSFLAGAGGWQRWALAIIAVVMSALICGWILKTPKNNKVLLAALALILGGAIGNLIDRIRFGYVVDFIHVYYQNHHFPAFNIADCAITLGAVLLLLDALILEPKRAKKQTV